MQPWKGEAGWPAAPQSESLAGEVAAAPCPQSPVVEVAATVASRSAPLAALEAEAHALALAVGSRTVQALAPMEARVAVTTAAPTPARARVRGAAQVGALAEVVSSAPRVPGLGLAAEPAQTQAVVRAVGRVAESERPPALEPKSGPAARRGAAQAAVDGVETGAPAVSSFGSGAVARGGAWASELDLARKQWATDVLARASLPGALAGAVPGPMGIGVPAGGVAAASGSASAVVSYACRGGGGVGERGGS